MCAFYKFLCVSVQLGVVFCVRIWVSQKEPFRSKHEICIDYSLIYKLCWDKANFPKKYCNRLAVFWISSPQHFWHQGLVSWKTVFPQARGVGGDGVGMILIRSVQPGSLTCAVHSRVHAPRESVASADLTGGVGAQAVIRVMRSSCKYDEASLTCLPLTSCCVAQFLTGHRPVVSGPMVETPVLDDLDQGFLNKLSVIKGTIFHYF